MTPQKVPARLHVILARKGPKAVIFRRGPTSKTAVIGWDRSNDSFQLGQWLYGKIYPYRCDLSPSGEYLIYFAAKYGRENPVEKAVDQWVIEEIGEIDWSHFETYWELRTKTEKKIRKQHAREIDKMQAASDYTDRSWTAISRAPYLKALSLWWNGTGWNGGGLWKNEKEFYLNRPPDRIAATVPGNQSRRFAEVPPSEELRAFGWAARQGECPMVYLPRLERDNWRMIREEDRGCLYHKALPCGLTLEKVFCFGYTVHQTPGKSVYQDIHKLLSPSGESIVDAANWEWADFDAYRKRVVYAAGGAVYALDLKTLEAKLLYDFNGMKYERIPAPY